MNVCKEKKNRSQLQQLEFVCVEFRKPKDIIYMAR